MEIELQAQFDKHYKRLIGIGFEVKVASYVAGLQKEGMIADDEWDSKALEALKSLPANSAISLLENLKSSNYRNAINKSAYLFSAIKAQRQRLNGERTNTPTLLSNGSSRNRATSNSEYKNQRSNSDSYSHNFYTGMAIKRFNGSNSLNSRANGFYPEKGCEILCRNFTKTINEDELLAIMEKIGPVWEIRIINPNTNRFGHANNHYMSYCDDAGFTPVLPKPLNGTKDEHTQLNVYVTFMTKSDAERAIKELNGYKIQGVPLKAQWSVNEGPRRLQLFNFDRDKTKLDVFEQYSFKSPGLVDVIYKPANDLCLLEYETHVLAEAALEKLNEEGSKSSEDSSGAADENTIIVDWARPGGSAGNGNAFNSTFAYYEAKPHEIKALHVRNLTEHIGEEALKELFERYGKLERVKKVRTFAFVHYTDPLNALQAMRELNNKHVANTRLQITVAKKPFNVVLSNHPSTTSTTSTPSPASNGHNTINSGSGGPMPKTVIQRGYSFSHCSPAPCSDQQSLHQHPYLRQYSDTLCASQARSTGPAAKTLALSTNPATANDTCSPSLLPCSAPRDQRYFQSVDTNPSLWDPNETAITKQYSGCGNNKYYQSAAHNDLTPAAQQGQHHQGGPFPLSLPPSLQSSCALPSVKHHKDLLNTADKNAHNYKISKLQPILDSVKEPLVGLKYVTEFHSYIAGVLTTSYDCSICEFGGTSSIPQHKIVDHIRSNDHIRSFIVKDHGEIWNALVEMAGKTGCGGQKGDARNVSTSMSTFFPMITETLEAQYGRQKISVKYDPVYQPRSYSSAVLDGNECHHSNTNVRNGLGASENLDYNLFCKASDTRFPSATTNYPINSSLYDQPFCNSATTNYKAAPPVPAQDPKHAPQALASPHPSLPIALESSQQNPPSFYQNGNPNAPHIPVVRPASPLLEQRFSDLHLARSYPSTPAANSMPTVVTTRSETPTTQWIWNGPCSAPNFSPKGGAGVEHSNPFTLPTFDLKLLNGAGGPGGGVGGGNGINIPNTPTHHISRNNVFS